MTTEYLHNNPKPASPTSSVCRGGTNISYCKCYHRKLLYDESNIVFDKEGVVRCTICKLEIKQSLRERFLAVNDHTEELYHYLGMEEKDEN